MSRSVKTLFHGAVGFVAVLIAYQLVLARNEEWWINSPDAPRLIAFASVYGLVAAAIEIIFRVERSPWRFASVRDAFKLFRSTVATALCFLLIVFILNRADVLPRSALVLAWGVQLSILAGARLIRRGIYEGDLGNMLGAIGLGPKRSAGEALLIVGDVSAADQALRRLAHYSEGLYRPVGVVTSNPDDRGKLIREVPVAGVIKDWDILMQGYAGAGRSPDAVLFLSDPRDLLKEDQLGALAASGAKLLRLPRVIELSEGDDSSPMREISIEELLSRPPVQLQLDHLRAFLGGKRVLVTGAGGSIGSEICRQVASFGCGHLAMLDHSEFLLFNIDREIGDTFAGLSRRDILCNVRDRDRIRQWFEAERPDVVFHAAALKHVPMVEAHPDQGFLTNVVGTQNVTDAAAGCGVADLVMISTDKAVAPTNVMGATKRLAESVVRQAKGDSDTRFTVVRFGNVLGSAGSVVPIFKDQIARGGPVTVTHPDVERYFMTIPEAVQLVLHASATRATDEPSNAPLGIHVLDMGEPVRVLDLAERMITLSGKVNGRAVQIEFIGLRPGEKLTEDLVDETEEVVRQRAGVMEVGDRVRSQGLGRDEVEAVKHAAEAGDHEVVRKSVYALIDKVRLEAPHA